MPVGILAGVAAMACLGLTGAVVSPVPADIDFCPPLASLHAADFRRPTEITNEYFPLVPGTQVLMEGRSNLGKGTVTHDVSFTVTDMVKTIDGVRTVAVWDRDVHSGKLLEEELAFFAQDSSGRVWNFGEYPEEIDEDFIQAPSTWLSGVNKAVAGIHMVSHPRADERWYLQGWAPEVAFYDCANLWKTGETISVPAGQFSDVVVTRENSPLDDTGGKAIQLKYHVKHIGIAQVGADAADPQQEVLLLTARRELTLEERRAANQRALELDERAYRIAPTVWTGSSRATLNTPR
ncbi:MAG: hypothetical protein U0360_01050 [Dehalococcoidia bacterium]